VILRASEEDLAALVSLECDLFGRDAWSESSWIDELLAANRLVLVLTHDAGAVIGYAVTARVGEVVDLLRIGVAVQHQRKGLASELLAELLREARAEGVHRVLLEVSATNLAAVEFYRAHGFVTIDRRSAYYRNGADALVMQYVVTAAAPERG